MATQHSRRIDVQIRWLIRRDMADVIRIENDCFEFPWTEEDFLGCLRQRNCIGMVAEHEQQILGYMVYELHRFHINILNFAVHAGFRHRQIGTQMAQKLIDKLSQQRRNGLVLHVRETNLDAQLFFRSRGFRAVSVIRSPYDDNNEDAYQMRYSLDSSPVDRISGFRKARH